MRVALLFAGQLRNVEPTYHQYLKPNLLDCNAHHEIDVFVHAWHEQANIGKTFINAGGHPCNFPIPENVLDSVYTFYNPTATLIEKQKDFTEMNNIEIFNSRKWGTIQPQYTMSRLYSTARVTQLCLDHTYRTQEPYDLVCITRFDWKLFSPFLFDSIDRNSISHCGLNPHGINVGLMIGNQGDMGVYGETIYSNLGNFLKEHPEVPFVDEIFTEAYITASGTSITRLNIPSGINTDH